MLALTFQNAKSPVANGPYKPGGGSFFCMRTTVSALAVLPAVEYCEPNHIRSRAGRVGSSTDEAFQ